MPAKTVQLANALLNHTLRNVPYVPPASVYLALCLTVPTATTPGVEIPTGPTAYVRQPIVFSPASSGSIVNAVSVVFPVALISWGNILAGEIWDTVGGGMRMYLAALGTPRFINVGEQAIFSPGTILVSEI